MKQIWVNGMMGVVVGDVLGMPVQFSDRVDLKSAGDAEMSASPAYLM